MESPVPFCAFCLRANPPNVEFYKHIVGSTAELRHSFQTMLGFDFHLANFSICKPCWKLMQLVQDFRLRCFKANGLVERIGQGLSSEDDWFSVKNLAILESVRMVIKDQVQQIEKGAVVGGEESMKECVTVDHEISPAHEGELVSTVEVSSIKIESVVSLNPETFSKDETNNTFSEKQHPSHERDLVEVESIKIDSVVSLNPETVSKDETNNTFSENQQPVCSKCGKLFQSKKYLKQHIAKCKGVKCQICFAKFTQYHRLESHMNQHTGETPFVCRKKCTRRFASSEVRTKHEAKCAKDEHHCTLCEEKFFTSELLQEHYKLAHPTEKKYRCKMCDGQFNRIYELKFHIQLKHKENAPKFPCPICGKKFSVQYNIKPHIDQVHGGEKRFQCEICHKRVTKRSNLRSHVVRYHPEAVSEFARKLSHQKQERAKKITKQNTIRKSMASEKEEKDSSKSNQPTLFDFKGFATV